MPSIRKVEIAAILTLLAGAAMGDSPSAQEMRPDDRLRLEELDQSAGHGLRMAFADGASADLDKLAAALQGMPLPAEDALALLPGDWSCQMMKLGGGLPIVVYPAFRCHVSADGVFEKLTGSQRTKGSLHVEAERVIYQGTGFVAGESPTAYEDLPETVDPRATPQFMPEIGVVELTGPDRGRILFPWPHLESDFNLLVLTR